MEAAEKDCSILGSLFQNIVNDLRNSSPIWEDFSYKATKLHQCLKTTLVAISSFLEAFQKVADMATNSKGATKEIGSALTRLCMRHRSIETCLKALTSSILDSVVAPLQERLEDWKKAVAQLDKDHAKEYKKARHEIKKAASDTMRLQKKVRKGIPHGKNEMQSKLDVAMQDVNARYYQLEETERNSVRTALIEERSRFCLFITCIKPFVDHEVHLLTEVTHLQEIMHSLCLQASEPQALPPASEQVIADLKGMDPASLSLQPHLKQHPSPPSSPSSLGSRKSSMCSINSINSSSSGSSKSHSPSHTMHKRTASQIVIVASNSSDLDAGDCDSTPTTPSANATTPTPSSSGSSSSTSIPSVSSPLTRKMESRMRPHTISAGSEKSYSRPPLKPELFEPLSEKGEPPEGVERREGHGRLAGGKARSLSAAYHHQGASRQSAATINKLQPVLPPHCPRPKVKAVAPPTLPPGAQPVYANTMDLQRMALENQTRHQHQQQEGRVRETAGPPNQQSAQQMQQNSLELAAAIRELEESTAALNSTYDSASHTSLQCSSGYGTMNSTPSGSEDTIAAGDHELKCVWSESEKSFTLPRSGDLRGAYRAALFPQRPASTAGVPASGANASRKSSASSPKPPPPVRKTGSVSSSIAPSGGGPSQQRQVSDSGLPYHVGAGSKGRGGQTEGAYAELQLIQQSIQQQQQQQKKKPQQPAPPPKPAMQRQHSGGESPHHHHPPHHVSSSSPSPDRMSISSGSSSSSGHYAVPSLAPVSSPGSASVLQSLNAQFASLNQQYQEPQYQQQQLMMMPSNGAPGSTTYVGGGGEGGDPTAASLMPPPAAPAKGGGGAGQGSAKPRAPPTHHPPPPGSFQHLQSLSAPGSGGHGQGQGHAPRPRESGNLHAQLQKQGEGEDFPMPPTAEELAEMETMYARPPPVTPKPKIQGDLLMELKRRMSAEEASDV